MAAGGRPAKNQAQILRSLILFTLLFNRTPAKTSLTALPSPVMALLSFPIPHLTENIFLPVDIPVHTGTTAAVIIQTPMQTRAGTAAVKPSEYSDRSELVLSILSFA